MTPLFKKLNFKDHSKIICLYHPPTFEEELKQMAKVTQVRTHLKGVRTVDFILLFVKEKAEIEQSIQKVNSKLAPDAVIWYCYPKQSSKKYVCDFNRDTGFEILGQYDLEGVRMVAIDQDWSALRFRHVDHIKKMTRRTSMALSDKGKSKTKK